MSKEYDNAFFANAIDRLEENAQWADSFIKEEKPRCSETRNRFTHGFVSTLHMCDFEINDRLTRSVGRFTWKKRRSRAETPDTSIEFQGYMLEFLSPCGHAEQEHGVPLPDRQSLIDSVLVHELVHAYLYHFAPNKEWGHNKNFYLFENIIRGKRLGLAPKRNRFTDNPTVDLFSEWMAERDKGIKTVRRERKNRLLARGSNERTKKAMPAIKKILDNRKSA